MQQQWLAEMFCPYCGGEFTVTRNVQGDDERVSYGLIECRCFTFPIVDSILMLSLAKGYGGAEEDLQPYVPMQVAAVEYLSRNDVGGLLRWMERHSPLAVELINGTGDSYLDFTCRLNDELQWAERKFLGDQAQFEVVGSPWPLPRRVAAELRRRLQERLQRDGDEPNALPTANDYYAARFFSPRVNALALQARALPVTPRLLSLCCGHGVFENILRALRLGSDVVSIDGQFLNLLITRRYSDHGGSYICHDLQFPLPFRDGAFDGVFSSTCLPEIPAQRTFVTQATRATAPSGWTIFDSIWSAEMEGVARINRYRHYRFCQNFFARLDDYLPMFRACIGDDRSLAVNVPDVPAAYVGSPNWTSGDGIDPTVAARKDTELSIAVLGRDFGGFAVPDHSWLSDASLGVSLAYTATQTGDDIALALRPEFANLTPNFAPAQFDGYPAHGVIERSRLDDRDYRLGEFLSARLTAVPPDFSDDPLRAGLQPASAGRD